MSSMHFRYLCNVLISSKMSTPFIFLVSLIQKNRKPVSYFHRCSRLKQPATKLRQPLLFLWTIPLFGPTKSDDSKAANGTSDKIKHIKFAIQEADELFESNKYEESTAALLPHKESNDVEILWRLSRSLYNQAQSSNTSATEKERLINEAYEVVKTALELDGAHWAVHKWMSVLLDSHTTYKGIKERVTQLEQVKLHMMIAVELNPKDATTFYMLGSWCYQIADMPWFQRKIAATVFAAPPTSSFEEALEYFAKAEEIQPRFYSQNLLMLGKTLMKLQKTEEAIPYLILARDYPNSTEEDALVRKEALEILKNLKQV